jgi:WD40 repeat protein
MLTLDTLLPLTPYTGLRSFETNERQYFFGRERQLDELLRKLRSNRFLAVVGTSGSGKSSLVKASLLPRLRDGFAGQVGQNWRIAVCTVGNNPIGNLAKQLAKRKVLHPDEIMDPNYPAVVEQLLRRGSLGIVEAFKQANIKQENLMIVIDQFDDIFRYGKEGKNEEEAATFVSLLLNASRQKDFPIYIVLTMRSSALGLCTEFRGLTEAINDGQFMIPRMKTDDLKKVIIAPAAQAGIGVDGELVNMILEDAGEDFDELAVLQHTMMRTWDGFIDWAAENEDKNLKGTPSIKVEHYKKVGGLSEALDRHAEEAYSEVTARDEKNGHANAHLCERMFRGLFDNGVEGKPVRRLMTVRQIMALTEAPFADVKSIIEMFSREGRQFLNAPQDDLLDEDSNISIAHESLLTRWKRLSGWVAEETESATLYLRMAKDAALYEKKEGSLYSDPELTIGLKWAKPAQFELTALAPTLVWATRYADPKDFATTIKFLEESEANHNAALGRVEYEQNRRMRSATLIAAGSALFGLICVLLLGVALIASEKANRNAKLAYRSAQDAQRSRYLAELSKQDADQKTFFAALSAAQANEERNKAASATATALDAALDAEKSAKRAEEESIRAKKEAEKAREAQILADNRRLEAINAQKQAELDREKAIAATNTALRIKALSLAQSIAVKSLDVTDENVEALLAREAHALNKINDGKPYDPYIYKALYEAVDNLNGKFNSLQDAPEGVKRIGTVRAICVKDSSIYSTGSEGYLLKWKNKTFEKYADHRKEENLPVILGKKPAVYRAMVMTADGKNLIRGGEAMNIEVFDPEKIDANPRIIRQDGYGKITSLVLMPNQKSIIFTTTDGTGCKIQYADIGAAEAKTITTIEKRQITDIAISADGKYLFGVGGSQSEPVILDLSDGGKKLLDLSAKFTVVASNNKNTISASSVATSPNGRYLAMGYSDGTVRIWDFLGEQSTLTKLPEPQNYHTATIQDLVFSNDSRMLGVASMDKSASLWQIETKNNEQPYKDSKFVPIKLNDHDDWVMSVAFSEKGDRFYSGTQNGVIKIWETNMDIYSNEICQRVQANLSDKSWRKYIGTDDPDNRELYISIPNNARRTPFSTCGGNFDQMKTD